MKNNPIVPYILILAFGIGLVFFMSLEGAGNKKEIAAAGEEGKTEQAEGGATSEADGDAALVQTCMGCHGGDLTGGMGPKLVGQDPDHIVEVLTKGIEGTPMTPGMKNEAEAKAIAEYISTLK